MAALQIQENIEEDGDEEKQAAYGAIPDENKPKVKTVYGYLDSVKEGITTRCVSMPMRMCLIVSLSFFFRFSASMAIQSLQSSLNDTEHLGVASLAVLYGMIIIFAPLAPVFLRIIGTKNVIILAWLIYAVYIGCNFYPTWATLIPISAISGAIAGPLFTAQGILISLSGEAYNKMFGVPTEEGLHASLSKVNGIFFMFYEAAGVSGNLISSTVLFTDIPNSTHHNPDKICGISASESVNQNINSSSTVVTEKPETTVVYILLSVYLVLTLVAMFILFALPKQEPPENVKKDNQTLSDLLSSLNMLLDIRMLLIIPLFMSQGMVLGFLDGDYTRDFISCRLGVHWVGYSMAAFRLFCAVFSISINCLAHYIGRFTLFIVAIVADTGALTAMLLWEPQQDDHIALYFLIPVVSGFADGILLPQFSALLAQVFPDDKTPAFAIYHMARASSLSITFALSTFVRLRYRLYMAIILYILGLVGYVLTELHIKRQLQDKKDKPKTDNDDANSICLDEKKPN